MCSSDLSETPRKVARGNVHRATGCIADHDAHRPRWVFLRRRGNDLACQPADQQDLCHHIHVCPTPSPNAHEAGILSGRRQRSQIGFGFLERTAGFDIPFKLVDWAVTNTYGRAVYVAILNTLLIAAMSVALSTFLGLLLGLLRLSSNWLARTVSMAIIEAVRNTPQLVQIFFLYIAVLQTLPQARNSLKVGDVAFLNIRGL